MFLAQRRRDRRCAQARIEGSECCEAFKFDKGLELFDRSRSFHGPQLQSQTGGFERISIPAPACRASGSVQRWTDDAPEFSRDAELHLPALRDAADRLRCMGRAEDRVECEVHWHIEGNQKPRSESLEIWRPATHAEDVRLLTARPKSTDQPPPELGHSVVLDL